MENSFYITRRFPCGHSIVYEHPSVVLRKMTQAKLVPQDQDFSQITVHVDTSDGCIMCGGVKTITTTTTTTTDMTTTKKKKSQQQQQQTKKVGGSLLKHTFCCDHNMQRSIHESILAKLRKHEVIPDVGDRSSPGGGGGRGRIVLEVESSYCEACQEAKMREVHESLRALKRGRRSLLLHQMDGDDDDDEDNGNGGGADQQQQLRRRRGQQQRRWEKELRDVFRQLEEAQLTTELAPRHFRWSLRIFADLCLEAIEPRERLQAWVQTLTANGYLVADVQKAIEGRERLVR